MSSLSFQVQQQPEIPPIIRDLCGHRSAPYCQHFHTPAGFPQPTGHIVFWEKLSTKIPSGHDPTTQHPTISPSLRQIFLSLQGTMQPKITGHISTFICIPEQVQTLQQQQLFDHSHLDFWKYQVAIVGALPYPPPVIQAQMGPDLDKRVMLGVADRSVL